MTNISLTLDDLSQARDEGTVIVMTGTDEATDDKVTFGADWRVMMTAIEILRHDGEVTVQVEGWQVLSRVHVAGAGAAP